MKVRCDLITVRHFQADGVITSRGCWVALEDCELRAGCQEGRRWAPWKRFRSEGVLVLGFWVSGNYRMQTCQANHCDQDNTEIPNTFQLVLPPSYLTTWAIIGLGVEARNQESVIFVYLLCNAVSC
jgi:hypothetical protein